MKVDKTFIKKVKKVCMPMAREIRLTFRNHEKDYKGGGLWGHPMLDGDIKEIHPTISEGTMISTFGIIHHTDITLSQKDILIPLCRNANKYLFKYVDTNGVKRNERQLNYLEPVSFNPREFHSVAPYGFPTKLPLILVTLTFPDSVEIEE